MKTSLPACPVCGLRTTTVFCGLQGQLLEELDRAKTVHVYRAGQGIFYEGAPALAVHCIRTGRVKLVKIGPHGDELVIRLLGPGETFGYRAILANEPYSATAEAVEETTVCTIPRETLLSLIRRSPNLAFEFLAKLAREMRLSEELMMELRQERVRQRTAHFMLMLIEEGGEEPVPGMMVRLPMKRKDIARMIGTSPETLSRTLRHLADRGILDVGRSEIGITNLVALRRLAGKDAPA
jgi:CRP/FNR family transcriptional regulator